MDGSTGTREKGEIANDSGAFLALLVLLSAALGVFGVVLQTRYTFTLQSPVRLRFQWPLVVARKESAEQTVAAAATSSDAD